MSECEHDKLMRDIYALIEGMDESVVVPMFMSIACGAAANAGVNRKFLVDYVMNTIDDAYKMFTRDDGEVVH